MEHNLAGGMDVRNTQSRYPQALSIAIAPTVRAGCGTTLAFEFARGNASGERVDGSRSASGGPKCRCSRSVPGSGRNAPLREFSGSCPSERRWPFRGSSFTDIWIVKDGLYATVVIDLYSRRVRCSPNNGFLA